MTKMTRRAWRDLALDVACLAKTQRQVAAIKLLRAHVNCGLKEAVDAVRRLKEVPDATLRR